MNTLEGKQIVVTRPKKQSTKIIKMIQDRGGRPYLFPVIKVIWPEDLAPLDQALKRIDEYEWICFTSVNGVRFFFERLETIYPNERAHDLMAHKNVAAIGPKTAQAIHQRGLNAPLLPSRYKQEDLIQLFKERMAGKPIPEVGKVLFPKAKLARKKLGQRVKALGFHVDEVEAYQTIRVDDGKSELLKQLKAGTIDVLTFTSSSTVINFVHIFEGTSWREYLNSVTIACIGPITSKTAKKLGLHVDVEAKEFTTEGMIDRLEYYFSKDKRV